MTLHIVDEHGEPICPNALANDALTDDQFWDQVAAAILGTHEGPDDEGPDEIVTAQLDPCPVCGECGPCGYDDSGRPLIHANDLEDEPMTARLLGVEG